MSELHESDPIARFRELFARAQREEPFDATAATLATADATARPSARMVLLKGADEEGFIFFTNYDSRKARELDANPRAALCIHWPQIRIQVRVEGAVDRLPERHSDEYFASRDRESQLGAWASRQSEELADPARLEARYTEAEERWAGEPVPRPEWWGGYRIVPESIEFWSSRRYRLHERIVYERIPGGWHRRLLYP